MVHNLDLSYSLKEWFQENKRDLPWRKNPSAYEVWISEVMLQQTQVAVVLPYFERWMQRFPTIESLAKAPLDEVIKTWEGLGYYSRARHLHEGAKYILQHCGGNVPEDIENLKKIKGLGPYTIGAILSFAFKKKYSAVDANVQRVLARLFAIKEDFKKSAAKKKVWEIAEQLIPDQEPWIFNEALIELGATICKKKPLCQKCPLNRHCLAFRHGQETVLPYSSKKTQTIFLNHYAAVITCDSHCLVKRGEKGKLMADLYEFPFIACEKLMTIEECCYAFEKQWGVSLFFEKELYKQSQSFTKFRIRLYPLLFQAKACYVVENFEWIPKSDLSKLAFTSGHRRILKMI